MFKTLQIIGLLLISAVAFANPAATPNPLPQAAQDQQTTSAPAEDIHVKMVTSLGAMVIKLYPEKAPETVKNFLAYVDSGFYDGVIVHRVVPNFVIQTGGFDKNFQRKPTANPIINESNNGLKNLRGTLSMARLNQPNSATSQFFINLVANPSLDWRPGQPGYAVFGEVVQGIAAIDSMALLEQGNYMGAFQNAPNEMVVVEKITRMPSPQKETKGPEKPVAKEAQPTKP